MLQIKTDSANGTISKWEGIKNLELHQWRINNPKGYKKLRIKSPHFHDEYQVGYLTEGMMENRFRNDNKTISPQQLYIIQPGEVHTEHLLAEKKLSFNFVFIPKEMIDEACAELTGKEGGTWWFDGLTVDDVALNQQLIASFQKCLAAFTKESFPLQKEEAMFRFVSLLVTAKSNVIKGEEVRHANAVIDSLKEYLQANVTDNTSLDRLAREMLVSKFHLGRMFYEQTGITLHKYLLQLKLCKARSFLNEGMSIGDTASHLGFTDKAHFTKAFKRFTAQTPGQFRSA